MSTNLETIFFPEFHCIFDKSGKEQSDSQIIFAQGDSLGEQETDYSSYLQKGEILMDLARAVYSKNKHAFCLTDAEKRIYSLPFEESMSMYEMMQRISRVFVRPCLKSMVSCDDSYANMLLEMVNGPGFKVSLSVEDDISLHRYIRAVTGSPVAEDDMVLCVLLEEEGYEPIYFLGTKNQVHAKKKDASWVRSYRGSQYLNVVDMGYLFASLIMYAEVMKYIRQYHDMDEAERKENELFCSFHEVIDTHTGQFLARGLKSYGENKVSVSSLSDLSQFILHLSVADATDKNLLSLLYDKGFFVTLQKKPSWRWGSETLGDGVGIREGCELSGCFLLHPEYRFSYHNLIGNRTDETHFFGLPQGCVYGKNSKKIQDTLIMKTLASMFHMIANERYGQKQASEYYNDLEDATHAKSYQLKKSIPAKVLQAMDNSVFNQYFGFVEFDKLTDLDKVAEIASEFQAVKETYFKNIVCSDNAIRFRRLGNHKALGLYYPSIKCLCVDIHSPKSLIHEFGHLIDYSLGRLSSEPEFRTIRKMYVQYLNDKMENDTSFKSSMKNGSKFNYSYYTLPTEIFARSFEVYVSKVLGVHNSILPKDFSKVYCLDEPFLKEVASYFNNLFQLEESCYLSDCNNSSTQIGKVADC